MKRKRIHPNATVTEEDMDPNYLPDASSGWWTPSKIKTYRILRRRSIESFKWEQKIQNFPILYLVSKKKRAKP